MGRHLPKLEWQEDKNRKAGGRCYYVHNRKPKFFNGGNGKSDREGYRKAQEKAATWLEGLHFQKPYRAEYQAFHQVSLHEPRLGEHTPLLR